MLRIHSSACFKDGYEVYGLIDAAGDLTPDAHRYGVKRMLQAGVVPITLESLVSEWMHDWNNPKAGELVKEVLFKVWGYDRPSIDLLEPMNVPKQEED